MGVMQALVSVVAQLGDQIQTLVAGDKNIIFRSYGHLILVAVGSSREPTSHLSVVLKYVYNQVGLLNICGPIFFVLLLFFP